MAPQSQAQFHLVTCDPSMQVGVPVVDEQHRTLIGELNRLIVDSQDDPAPAAQSEVLSEVLSQLGRQLTAHFDCEEQVLHALGMPAHEIDAHRAAHVEIISRYTDLNLELMRARSVSRTQVLSEIREWVVGHILAHDLRIRSFLPA